MKSLKPVTYIKGDNIEVVIPDVGNLQPIYCYN